MWAEREREKLCLNQGNVLSTGAVFIHDQLPTCQHHSSVDLQNLPWRPRQMYSGLVQNSHGCHWSFLFLRVWTREVFERIKWGCWASYFSILSSCFMFSTASQYSFTFPLHPSANLKQTRAAPTQPWVPTSTGLTWIYYSSLSGSAPEQLSSSPHCSRLWKLGDQTIQGRTDVMWESKNNNGVSTPFHNMF